MMRNAGAIRGSIILGANAAVLGAALAVVSCGSSGSTVTSPSTLSKCAVTVGAPGTPVPASGGSGSIDVRTERECQWTAQPEVGWVSITAGSTGQGPGTVQFAVGANADPATRTGGVMVNGQRAQVTQAAGECKYELSSSATSLPQAGGTGSVDVHASSPLCTWTAASDATWISVTSNASGKGSATVGFTVASTTGPPRTGTLTIAGIRFAVTQSEGCAYVVSPSAIAAGTGGGPFTVTVTTSAGCPWTASSNQPWITIASDASSNGAGTVSFNVASATGPPRSGTLTVAGQTVTVTQGDACTFGISPESQSVAPSGGSGAVSVTAPAGCGWNASSNASWISITSGGSGSGNGTVNFTVTSTNGPVRSGTLTIAGRTFTVNQGQGCTFSLSTTAATSSAAGGAGSFDVRTSDGCGWSAASNASWLTVTGGASGTGNGTVRYTAAANSGPQRSGTVTAGGQTFTVTQSGGCAYALSAAGQTVPAAGGSGSFAVNTVASCSWSASVSAGWISITSGATGNGPGTVQFAAAANTTTARTGTITVGAQTFTITQDSGCSAAVGPDTIAVPAAGGSQNVGITTPAECAWTAVSNAAWISIPPGNASGNGNATVHLDIQPNTEAPRNGTATIAGRVVTVNQESGCQVSLTPPSQVAAVGSGSGSVAVSAGSGCVWTAVSSAAWIAVTAGAGGSGNGTVQFTFEANMTGMPRSGTITIGGQPFTINQAGS